MVRFFAERVGAVLNRNVQVDNRIAENGNAGTSFAAKAKPDGYTIMITPGSYTLATAPAILKKPGFDPTKDFVPVTTLFKLNYAVLVDANRRPKPQRILQPRSRPRATRRLTGTIRMYR